MDVSGPSTSSKIECFTRMAIWNKISMINEQMLMVHKTEQVLQAQEGKGESQSLSALFLNYPVLA